MAWGLLAAQGGPGGGGRHDPGHRWPLWNPSAYFQNQYCAENFTCWVAIHHYTAQQHKRSAVFINEQWLSKPSNALSAPTLNQSLFDNINFSSELSDQPAMQMTVSWMKMVMTRDDKAGFSKDQIAFLGHTPPDLFDGQFSELGTLLSTNMNRFNSDDDVMPGDLATMKAAGFDMHRYGPY